MKINRRKSRQLSLKVPGEIFLKHIQFGTPPVNGIYLGYTKPPYGKSEANDNFPIARLQIFHYVNKAWNTPYQVLAWIGPLPVLSLDELDLEKECVSKMWAIGTLKQAAKTQFISSNHPQYVFAFLKEEGRKKGNFIFEINSRMSMPLPISKFSEVDGGRWIELKEDEKDKYIKTIQRLTR